MNTLFARLILVFACLLCIGVSACSSLLHMSYLAATGLSAEIRDPSTTIERRSEIAQGLENATWLQMQLVNATWWLSLLAIVMIAVVAFWGFRNGVPAREIGVHDTRASTPRKSERFSGRGHYS